MAVNVLVSNEASEVLGHLPTGERDRLLSVLDGLSEGIPAAAVPVTSGADRPLYAARLGDRWRVIFSADQPVSEIIVLKVFEKQAVDASGVAVAAHL